MGHPQQGTNCQKGAGVEWPKATRGLGWGTGMGPRDNLLYFGAGAQPRLKSWGGPRFGSQHRGTCAPRPAKGRAGCRMWEGIAPSRCEGSGYHPQKIFENSDAKSCILVTTCCEISCFLRTTVKKLGGPIYCRSPNLKVGGPISCGLYGCCAYFLALKSSFLVLFESYFNVAANTVGERSNCRPKLWHILPDDI